MIVTVENGRSTFDVERDSLAIASITGASNRYLRFDGTWSVPPGNNTDTTYSLSKNSSTITLTDSDGSTTSVMDSNTIYTLKSFGVDVSAAELNYVKGVMSSIQTQLNSKAASNHTHSDYLTTSGTATDASKPATARTISLAGDVTGSANFDGSANIFITGNIAADTVGTNELASNAVTNAKIAADSVSLAKLGSDVGTIAVQSKQPSDTNVRLWIQI